MRYRFNIAAATRVTVRLVSTTDPYLHLYEGHENTPPDPDTDHEDDDSAGSQNALLRAIELEPDDYTIEATTFSSGVSGSFTLSITAVTLPSVSDSCALDLGSVDGTHRAETALSKISTCTSISRRVTLNSVGEYETLFLSNYIRFTLDEEQIISIDLVSSDDTYLYLLDGSGARPTFRRSNDDGGFYLNSRLYGRLVAGDYTIEATTNSAPSSASRAASVDVYIRASDSEEGSTTYGNTCPRPADLT